MGKLEWYTIRSFLSSNFPFTYVDTSQKYLLTVGKADAGDVNARMNTTVLECISDYYHCISSIQTNSSVHKLIRRNQDIQMILRYQVVDILHATFALNHLGIQIHY